MLQKGCGHLQFEEANFLLWISPGQSVLINQVCFEMPVHITEAVILLRIFEDGTATSL